MNPHRPPHPRARELRELAAIVASIEANQLDHPEYCEGIAEAIVHNELKRLEDEGADEETTA